jgi:hypothetical protein
MAKENICSYHGDIMTLAKKIKQTKLYVINDNYSQVTLPPEIIQWASEIYELVKQAKKAGCRMENRLQVYKDGIENMGFTRRKRKKYERK